MAFEIEGRNVPESSLAGDRRKFQELPSSCAKSVVLYTVRDEWSHSLPGKRMMPVQWFQERWQPRNELDSVRVRLDTEPSAPEGIDELQELPKRRATL